MAVVSVFDSEPGPARDAPYDWGMDRARWVFPYPEEKLNHEIGNCEYAFLRNWRRHSDRLSFTNGFGNDRVTRAHH